MKQELMSESIILGAHLANTIFCLYGLVVLYAVRKTGRRL